MENKCLYPACEQVPYGRGLCFNHYQSAARFVKQGRTDWPTLIKLGKAKPVRKRKTWFLDQPIDGEPE